MPAIDSFASRYALVALTSVLACSCTSNTSGELSTFAGEWCTLRGLGDDNLPVPGVAYVAMVSVEQGTRVLGTGSSSPPDSDSIYAARFRGDIVNGRALIEVSDLDDLTESPGPTFMLDLEIDGPRDLVGTMSGDSGFNGAVNLVRLGPRCFEE